jgi:tellurium resistance protein TerD
VGVSLSKGGNVSLSKEVPGLTAVLVGLGWDVRTTTGTDYDLDASALLLDASGKVLSDQHFIFYNNLKSPDGSVEHTGDNLTGEGEGDDEVVKVNLAGVPAEIDKIVFPVSIHDAENRGQSFGQVRGAFIRVVNQSGGAEIARYDLSEDAYHRDGDGLRRAVPQRRQGAPPARAKPRAGAEVPCRRAGLRLRAGRDRRRLRRQRLRRTG